MQVLNMFNRPYACARVAIAAAVLCSSPVLAQDYPFSIELAAGPSWQAKNDVQIPNDSEGTRFSLKDLAGDGPWAAFRLNAIWNINDRHGIRLLLAPLSYTETGTFDEQVDFAGQTYAAGTRTKASYRFNSYRLSYRYHFYDKGRWNLWVGATAKIRDAEIKLKQGDVSSKDDNVGFVPLLYFAADYRLSERWSLAADIDALAGGPGRAIDLGLMLNYSVGPQWKIGFGYRGLEGGVDNDEVYNFAWFNSALISANYRF